MAKVFWASDSCTVWLDYGADGGLEFSARDLGAFGDPAHCYDYVVSVPVAEFAGAAAGFHDVP